MAIQLILGNSGSGKSYELYRTIIDRALKEPQRNFLIIVPEQFTMQTQKELVRLHPNHAIRNIDVLSFARLAHRVLAETGQKEQVILEDTGKNFIIRKVANEHKDELTVLTGNLKRMGYIDEIKSFLTELTQYDISVEKLKENIEKIPQESLRCKLSDVAVLYKGFRTFIEDRFITSEEILEELADVSAQSELLKDCVLAFDGFTGFTPIQNKLMHRLIGCAQTVYITLLMDAYEDPFPDPQMQELFYLTKKAAASIHRMAMEEQVDLEEPIVLSDGGKYRFADAPALYHLEQNLFRKKSVPYDKPTDEIALYSLKNAREELLFAAHEIHRLVREKGYRYRDIAIVSGQIDKYESYVRDVFAMYDLPYFVDTTKQIVYHPLIEMIRSGIRIVVNDYAYEEVVHFLRCGLSGFEREQIDLFENYILASGIRGKKRYHTPWTKNTLELDDGSLKAVDEMRESIVAHFDPFYEVIKSKKTTVLEKTTELYDWLVSFDVAHQLEEESGRFEEQGETVLAKQYGQIYAIIMELLDKAVALLGEEEMSGKEYLELLEAGMSAAKVGVIPPGTDYILIGDIERTRLDHIKVLFFLGVNDGVIPKGAQSGGILSEIERETLTGSDMELAPGMRERAFIQRFYLYMNLTKPMKRLYVTYGRMDMDGKAVRRSFLIPTLLRLFPRLTVTEYEESDLYAQPSQTLESMRTTLIDHTRQLAAARGEATKDYLKLLSLYREREDGFVQKVMQAAYYEYRKEVLSGEEALKLYGKVLVNTVTRLEQYAQCAFAHFAAYGLRLSPRRIPSFEPVDMGSVLHLALERYSKLLRENGLTYLTVSEEQRQELIDEAIDDAVSRPGVEILFDNARNEYQIQRIRRIFERTIWAVTKQLEAGEFVPYATEVPFRIVKEPKNVEVHAAKYGEMRLKGRIDRIDLVEKEDKVLVKIVDYKSSGRDFDWAQFYYGLSLQLPLYLEAACEQLKEKYPDKEIVPAGILYYGMNDPLISLDLDAQQQQIDEELLKQLKPKGLLNSEDEVLVLFDTPKEGSSLVAPIGYNKNGSLKKGSSVADSDAFQQILHHTDRSIRRIAGEMYEGNVSVEPYELSGKEACTYCDYKSVCGFDPMLKGCDWRILEPLEEEEVLMRMKKEAQEEAENKEAGKESLKGQE